MKLHKFFFYVLLTVLTVMPLHVLALPQDELQQTIRELNETRSKAKQLKEQVSSMGEELDELQSNSAALVQQIRAEQEALDKTQAALQHTQQAIDKQSIALAEKRETLAALLHGAIRMQSLPRSLVIAQPKSPENLLRTASALHITYRTTAKQLQHFSTAMAQLAQDKNRLQQQQEQAQTQLASLQEKEDALVRLTAKRQALYRNLRQDHRAARERIAHLSQTSSSLKELVARLEKETELFQRVGTPSAKPEAPSRDAILFAARKGALPLPARGRLVYRYGDKKGKNDTYSGLVVRTSPNAPVTAPHRGRVVYSGEFLDYGNMLIIQHDDTYHSVIAGLDVMHVETGQQVSDNMLIGVMGRTDKSRKLYYELRKHSKAIDPASWMGNLNT